jgi:hypothetical protein
MGTQPSKPTTLGSCNLNIDVYNDFVQNCLLAFDADKCSAASHRMGPCENENAFVSLLLGLMDTCAQLKKPDAPDTICQGIKTIFQVLLSPQTAGASIILSEWAEKGIPQGIQNFCSTTSSPISAQQMTDSLEKFKRQLMENMLTGPQKFLLDYGVPMAIILVVVFGMLVAALVLRKKQ